MNNYALIKNNIVVNVIVADQKFIDLIKKDYDYCIQIDPSIPGSAGNGDSYDPKTKIFTKAVIEG